MKELDDKGIAYDKKALGTNWTTADWKGGQLNVIQKKLTNVIILDRKVRISIR